MDRLNRISIVILKGLWVFFACAAVWNAMNLLPLRIRPTLEGDPRAQGSIVGWIILVGVLTFTFRRLWPKRPTKL
jgi:hypothetical protein